jgi:hypothetical protein
MHFFYHTASFLSRWKKNVACTYLLYKKLTDMVQTKKVFRAFPPGDDDAVAIWAQD